MRTETPARFQAISFKYYQSKEHLIRDKGTLPNYFLKISVIMTLGLDPRPPLLASWQTLEDMY